MIAKCEIAFSTKDLFINADELSAEFMRGKFTMSSCLLFDSATNNGLIMKPTSLMNKSRLQLFNEEAN